VHFDYGPKGKSKTHFEGKICSDGIEVDGIVSSASVSALRCIQQISPSRTTTNGWVTWKTANGRGPRCRRRPKRPHLLKK
jgi:hypothetical protein